MELEQEVASVIGAVQRTAGDIGYCYWNLPKNFRYPCIYFPQPEIITGGDTLGSYASEYAWYITVHAKTTEDAHGIALAVLTALKEARNYVPLLNEDGTETGKNLRLKDPSLRPGDTGVAHLTIEWTSRRPYAGTEPVKVQKFKFLFSKNEEESSNGE